MKTTSTGPKSSRQRPENAGLIYYQQQVAGVTTDQGVSAMDACLNDLEESKHTWHRNPGLHADGVEPTPAKDGAISTSDLAPKRTSASNHSNSKKNEYPRE